jgi:hypothetical protein
MYGQSKAFGLYDPPIVPLLVGPSVELKSSNVSDSQR